MASIRWYLDEDTCARALIQGLRARGVDVATPLETGMMAEPDQAQLEFACARRRVIYTFNVGDFCRLHAEYLESGKTHAGIVVVPRQRYPIGIQVRGLLELTSTRSAQEMVDNLVFLRV